MSGRGRKTESIRWYQGTAASEFGIAPKTLKTRMTRLGIECRKDGTYSTKQICEAVFGDLDSEKLRLVREQADQVALKNAEARKELVALADIASGLNRAISGIKATIMAASNLEREDKEKILKACGDMWQSSLSGPSQPDESDMESTAAL